VTSSAGQQQQQADTTRGDTLHRQHLAMHMCGIGSSSCRDVGD
jgi:hypothetical protein